MNDLKEWTKHYVRMRAAARGVPADIHETSEGLSIVLDGKMTKYLVQDTLHVPSEYDGTIVTQNTKENIDTVLQSWETLARNAELTILFVNMKDGERWALKPYHHNIVADKTSLKQGLHALYAQCAGTAKEPERGEPEDEEE